MKKIDYSFKILEAVLMAKSYKNREDVISTAMALVNTVCALGHLAPAWITGYKEAYKKLNTLSFGEMKEIIRVLQSYEGQAEEIRERDRAKGIDDIGEEEYNKGMKAYAQEQYSDAVYHFCNAAFKGNAKGEYNYALCLYGGKGRPVNKVEAIKRFVYAADCGIEQAEKMLHYIAYGDIADSDQK